MKEKLRKHLKNLKILLKIMKERISKNRCLKTEENGYIRYSKLVNLMMSQPKFKISMKDKMFLIQKLLIKKLLSKKKKLKKKLLKLIQKLKEKVQKKAN